MAGIHVLIGLGEAAITALVLAAVARTRPDLLPWGEAASPAMRAGEVVAYGLTVALALAVFVAPFACPWPDGLEHVAETLGFAERAGEAAPAPLPDYAVPGVGAESVSTAIAGLAGTAAAFAVSFLLARVLVPRKTAPERTA
jgi:hypothetical protein